ncbi:MAG: M3 family metallopeptidase [Vitreoscilla sp.]|nr:M3 family metallopeptidase [Vitreoscilla sp.]
MHRRKLMAAAMALPFWAHPVAAATRKAAAHDPTRLAALLAPWTGPYGGVPPFDRIRVADFEPALVQAMAWCRAEIDAIANNPAPPNFDNTLVALEKAGAPMDRAVSLFGIYSATLSDAAVRRLELKIWPQLAAFNDQTTQDERLFQRIAAVQRASDPAAGSPEQRRLSEVVHRHFVRHGAALDAPGKRRVKEINQRLASLYTQFSQNQLADEEKYSLELSSEADLEGLPQDLRDAARAAATSAGKPGRWLITNTRSAMEPFITCAAKRSLREAGWRMWVQRGDNNDANDNKAVIGEILQLRGERAHLLGFASHAHWITGANMAGTPEAAMALMMRVWPAAAAKAREEIADMQALADREGAGLRIEPWDYRYYAEKVRLEKYAFDGSALKPYLQLDRLRQAMFWAAGQVHGLAFRRLRGVPVCHPDVSVYSVHRGREPVGLWYFDPYARTGKNSGAWMNNYRNQHRLHGPVLPIVSNNANFIKGKPGEPVLISWDDAVTLFHEFGHALHGLSSQVGYPTLSGTAVLRDFVEFPSQINEHWLSTPEVLNRFALHHKTGQPMPAALLAANERARNFTQGFATAEYLAAAIYDMAIHLAPSQDPIDPMRFERDTLARIGCPSAIVMRHRPTHFGHIFSGDGYSAGYYSYLWAETLTADAAEAFKEAGSFYNPTVAKRLRESIFSVGNTVAPGEAYRRFRGRDADPNAIMRERGFPVG